MFRDLQAWATIRRAVLEEGVSKRQICRETGLHWHTLQKILRHDAPPGFNKGTMSPSVASLCRVVDRIVNADRLRPPEQRHTPEQIAAILRDRHDGKLSPAEVGDYITRGLDLRGPVWNDVSERLGQILGNEARGILLAALPIEPLCLSLRRLNQLRRVLGVKNDVGSMSRSTAAGRSSHAAWVLRVLLGKERLSALRDAVGDLPDLEALYRAVRAGGLQRRTRALVVLASRKGVPHRRIARILNVSGNTVSRCCRVYREGGAGQLLKITSRVPTKRKDKGIRDAVFEVLHSPPSAHDINRTTWKMDDLRRVLMEKGVDLSRDTIRAIIRDSGYRWRKAREVLTSNDPEYLEKLKRMTAILSALKPGERFFSIDEFGPFAVKMKGGRVLARPGEIPSVPQFQKSKGKLIVTAALELSTNHVTHFYSTEKNTGEMLKLIDRLLGEYAGCDKLYLSWDAASWHDSQALHVRVEQVNSGTYRPGQTLPRLEFVPLPSRAQFLNVIEAVFSGMAKAIIHGSDYQSIDEAQQAIDRYFRERNEHFKRHPKRAGKKIWGKEPVPSEFSLGNNCKDPRWCRGR